ncbi:phosphonate ABC transporter ATP-binding protein [Alkalihalobacillus sp. BA299]|uniref:phosphonate ABC transporter ATP-binding protein n=1 Tax=Alkalihalobacillus sp. BA299 TaxID=2815938 RepID=UPI001ADA779E|nr:phosphonate ABC transporter ATP-binding protein [Alkalihalobacillus sp. BA299]
MLELDQLSLCYRTRKQAALSNVSLSFRKGEFVCILGKSGAGKSTLIRCINGLQRPTSGKVIWREVNISSLREKDLRNIRKDMGMIFQHFNLIPRMSVYQNVLIGMFGNRSSIKNFLGIFSKEEKEEALRALENVELIEQSQYRIEELSGGQKQRVAIARALLQQPKLFLGDEPVASLDPSTSKKIFELLQTIHNEQQLLTIINVHDVELAKKFATRIVALKDGRVIFDGKPEDFTDEKYALIYDTSIVNHYTPIQDKKVI